MNNQIFGYEILPGDIQQNYFQFEGAKETMLDQTATSQSQQLKFFSTPNTSLQYCCSDKYKAYCYVWGIPVHPKIAAKDIPEWCVRVATDKRYDCFKELLGTFVIIIDQPEQKQITFITDILGIRPVFVGNNKGRLVFGSRVMPMYKAGLSAGLIDYNAVASWIAYKYNLTDGALFKDLQRLRPGSVVIFEDGKSSEIPYAEFQSKPEEIEISQAAEEIHRIVSATAKQLLDKHQRLLVALSGGFDSRYLLALALSSGKTSIDCATVSFNHEEGYIARQVAEKVGIPVKTYDVNGSIWDLYDEVYHFMADGFPITKFVTERIAKNYIGIPMLNGFMGDALIRGDSDRYNDKYETEWEESLVDVLQRKHTKINYKLYRKDIAEKIQIRSRTPMERAVREGTRLGKVFGWQDYYYTHRFYISNNFLQHIHLSEALLPFYSWSLLSYKMEHAYKVFIHDTYRMLYRNFLPELADIPRSSDIKPLKNKPQKMANCSKKWAKKIMPEICSSKWLSLLHKRLCIPLNIAGLAGLNKAEFAIHDFYRLYLFEKELKNAGINFDWDSI